MIKCNHCGKEVYLVDSRYTDEHGFECISCYLMRRNNEESWKTKNNVVVVPANVRVEDKVDISSYFRDEEYQVFSFEYLRSIEVK